MYSLIRNILFLFEAEKAHYISMNMLKKICSVNVFRKIISLIFSPSNPSLQKKLFGLHFKNPIGLGAGFDKNAWHTDCAFEVFEGFEIKE